MARCAELWRFYFDYNILLEIYVLFLAQNSLQMVAGSYFFAESITWWYICAHPSGSVAEVVRFLFFFWFFLKVWALADVDSRN